MDLVRVPVTDAHRAAAAELAESRPVYRLSHRGSAANAVGALGEVLVLDFLTGSGLPVAHDDVTTHDLRLPHGATLEVKTKDRTVHPRPHYECSVPLYNHEHQQPDFYMFVSLQRDRATPTGIAAFHTGYICGAASLLQVHRRAATRRTGWTDPANGTKFWTACQNLTIEQLVSPRVALDRWLRDAEGASLHR